MPVEIAELVIKAGVQSAFEEAVAKALPLFEAARGCRSARLERSVDCPERYRLVVNWETIEDHMVHFRESPAFQEWRALAGPHFAEPPRVDHVEIALEGFGAG
ncbi:MAG: antibiotic biosynthesis monooxygenase family protein [Allosphingosinicella sp.]